MGPVRCKRFSEVGPPATAAPAALLVSILTDPGTEADLGFEESSWVPVIGVRVERTGRNMVRVTVDEVGLVSGFELAVGAGEDLLSEGYVVLKLRGECESCVEIKEEKKRTCLWYSDMVSAENN